MKFVGGLLMTIANIINTIEYKMGSCALCALRHSKKYGKANLAILNNEYCEKYYGGGGKPYNTSEIASIIESFEKQHINLSLFEKFKLVWRLRKIKILHRIYENIYKRILHVFPQLKQISYPITSSNDIAIEYGIKNSFIYRLGLLIQNHQRKHKPHHYLYNINKEIQRFQKVKLLQSILNNVIYGATSTISIQDMGIINIDFFTYDCTDVAEIESIGRGKINLLDSRDKTIEFIIIHLDSIQAWLQSDAFRTQYFNNKHPYPPLLNPKQIDYKNLDAEIAWDLNIPLPQDYEFVAITRGLQGHSAFHSFLNVLFDVSFAMAGERYGDSMTRVAYLSWYRQLVQRTGNGQRKHILFLVNIVEEVGVDKEKLGYLCWEYKEIFCLVRDPISRIKSGANHSGWTEHSIEQFNLTYDCDTVVQYWMSYANGVNSGSSDKPDLMWSIQEGNLLQPVWLYIDSYFMPIHGKVHYIDMNEIIGVKTIETMQKIATQFGVNMPNDTSIFLNEAGGIVGYMLMGKDKILYIHESDVQKTNRSDDSLHLHDSIKVYITHCMSKNLKDLVIVDSLFLESKKFQNLFIAMTQKDLESLQNNPVLFNVTKQYLQFLMVALEKRVAIEEAKKLNDTQILDFLMKQNKLKVLKDILDKETARIKRLRPDIVKSWKSYQAFEKLCKDNNIA